MSSQPNPPAARWDSLLNSVADQIKPLFRAGNTDQGAKLAALSAIGAYNPQSRADFVNIARILAFSMATLAALGIAAGDDLPAAQKMRYFGRANALNRSADQSERIMMQRRRDQRANPPAESPACPEEKTALTPADDRAIDAAVEEAMAVYRAAHVRPLAEPAAPKTQSAPQRPDPFTPAHATVSAAVEGQRPKASYRQSLLQRSAMHCVVPAAQIPLQE